jgi:hypothetical protein
LTTYPLVLLANEPPAFRSLLAAELPFLRPDVRVVEVAPAQLYAAVADLHPSVVICSQELVDAQAAGCAVLTLHSGEVDTFVRFGDETIVNPRLPDILRVLDHALRT